jgi:hypothetical protein
MKLLKLSLYLILFLISTSIFFNVFINAYGYYGDRQLNIYSLSVSTSKLHQLSKKDSKPEAFIMGSSNSLSMKPEIVEEKTGLKCYNYGIFQFTIEDFYCATRAIYEDAGCSPKLIILCIDDWALAEKHSPKDEVFKGAQNRLSYKPILSKYLPDYSVTKLNWFRFKSALSYEQLKVSVPEFYNRVKSGNFNPISEEEKLIFFNADGTRIKFTNSENIDITAIAESGEYDVEKYLKEKNENLLRFPNKPKGIVSDGHEIFNKLSEERLNKLENTIKFLQSKNCKIIINIMPLQPYYQKLILENTNYAERIKEINTVCNAYAKKYSNILLVKDNHDIHSFDGNANGFFDEMHITSTNSRLILQSLLNNMKKDAFQ